MLTVITAATARTHIQRFTESDGLPQSTITCVIQDSKGYIWISSWNGLSRFDGYSFQNFKARQGDNCPLTTNRIFFIRETTNGNILCKCPDGFYLFRVSEKRFVTIKGKRCDNGDRFRPTPRQKEAIMSLPEYQGVEARILLKDRQDGYWIYTHRGLDRLTFTKDKICPMKYGNEGEEFIRTIFRSKDGILFIADKNGFVRLVYTDGKQIGYLTQNGSVVKTRTAFGANVYCMYEDSRGCLWAGTKPCGLFRLSKTKNGGFTVKSFTKDNRRHCLNCNSIYAIKEDNRGRILVGTYGGGLNIIDDPESDSPKFVNCDNGMTQYPATAKFVYDMLVRKDGTLLLATSNGLLVTAPAHQHTQGMTFLQNRRVANDPLSISNNQVMALLQTKDGGI